MSEAQKKKRVLWVDVAKCIGIFTIYLGHYGDAAGNGRTFVYLFHVPLFFFLSGCMNTNSRETSFLKFAWKRFKMLMIPYFAFNVVSIALYAVMYNAGTDMLRPLVVMALAGDIRNACVPFSLWFFSCLYLMEIIFFWLKKIKIKPLILAISFLGFVLVEGFMTPDTGYVPHWYYNLDTALYFIYYYALGYWVYPYIAKLFELDTKKKQIIFWVTGLLTAGYAAFAFEGRDGLMPLMRAAWVFYFISPILRGMILVWFSLFVSKLLEKIPLLGSVGRETLYLCGNEYIIKELVPLAFQVLQIEISLAAIKSPASTYLYTAGVMFVAMKLLIPCEKKVVESFKAYTRTE